MRLEVSLAERQARLGRFLQRLAPVAAIFGLAEAWAGLRLADRPALLAASVILLFAGTAIVADRFNARGRTALACALVTTALMASAFLLVGIQPALYPSLALVPLLAVAIAYPHVEGTPLATLLVGAVVAVGLISASGALQAPGHGRAHLFTLGFGVAATSAVAAFVFYLLWQYSHRFAARLRDEATRAERLEAMITDLSGRERQARVAALRDPLTGLANRRLLLDRLEQAMGGLGEGDHQVGLLFVDLDGFKAINDRHGHAAGDDLLVAVAAALGSVVRSTDTLARIGGDEFVVVMPRVGSPFDAEQVARRFLLRLRAPLAGSWGELEVRLSIGLAVAPQDGGSAAALLRAADRAMYSAKQEGGSSFGWVDPQLRLPLPQAARARSAPARS
jgi:diguanylate cyclase (GGDEF)-like protein